MTEPTERDRELLAVELRRHGEENLAVMVRSGADNSAGGTAALRAIAGAREEGRREENDRCAKIAREIKLEADRDSSDLGPDGDAAVCWADCAATILHEIERQK